MISKDKHQKHPPLIRRKKGNFHAMEWGIYGTSCEKISVFYNELKTSLSKHFDSDYLPSFAYIDGVHDENKQVASWQMGVKHSQINQIPEWNDFDDVLANTQLDAVFINGNHYPASRQMVCIDDRKKESLYRRKDQLTDIWMVIRLNESTEIYDFVQEKMNPQTVVMSMENIDQIAKLIMREIRSHIPPLKAIILAGGKSSRMKEDKSIIKYHAGKSQQIFMADMCADLGIETFISKAHDYKENRIERYSVIKDRFIELGPFGAIASAFLSDPNAAWLVLACDLPLLNEETLKKLVERRNPYKLATAIQGNQSDFPEPLITIYEPKAYVRFMQFLSLGYACPRKVLINSEIKTVFLDDDSIIENINTPEERDRIKSKWENS